MSRTKELLMAYALKLLDETRTKGFPNLDDVHFVWGRGMTATAGRAEHFARSDSTGCEVTYGKRVVLSQVLLTGPDRLTEFKKTVLHELAHLIAGPGHGHDEHWRQIDIALGNDGAECHTMPVKAKRNRRWPCRCSKCGKEFTLPTMRARAMEDRGLILTHNTCGGGRIQLLRSTWS